MHDTQVPGSTLVRGILATSLGLWAALAPASESGDAFIPRIINSSTIPSNGDLNPYGVAFVPERFPGGGAIAAGDVLVSNFNNSANVQGTGTTIGQGALQVIDRRGHLVQTLSDPQLLDGPWDLAVDDHGDHAHIFVSNVLNGTVSRLDVAVGVKGLTVLKKTTIAAGYTHRPDPAALILGPTGLAFDRGSDLLYVASTADNAIYVVPHAGSRTGAVTRGAVAFADSHLRGPLALRFAPNGNLLAANGDAVNADVLHPSEIVEFTAAGQFVREYNVDSSQGGAFGLDTLRTGPFDYAVIDDVTNNLTVYRLEDR